MTIQSLSSYSALACKTGLVLLAGKGVTDLTSESYKLYNSSPKTVLWKSAKGAGALSLNLLGKAATLSLDLCKKAMGNGDPVTVGAARATILLGILYVSLPEVKATATILAVASFFSAVLMGARRLLI